MKRYFLIVLVLALVCALLGCSKPVAVTQDLTTFYYCRADYAYGSEDGIVTAEQRDITGHAGDPGYILALYLMGPMEETFVSPFPASTRLLAMVQTDEGLFITLTDLGKSLSDAEFTLACSCLTKTCLDVMDIPEVTITSGERTITLQAADLLLYDDGLPAQQNTEETQ